MLNRAIRPLGSASNHYVCISCRYWSTNLPQVQVRRESHVTSTNAPNNDSWFDTINQINDEFPGKKHEKQTTKENPQTTGSTKNSNKHETSTRRAAKENERHVTPPSKNTDGKRSANVTSKTQKSSNGSNARTPSIASPSEPLTIAQKVREAKSRAKWGGMSEEKRSSGGTKSRPSHDSLRKADKISPEAVIESAINKRPYGFHADSANKGNVEPEVPVEVDALSSKPKNPSSRPSPTRRNIRERRKAKRLSTSSKPTKAVSPPISSIADSEAHIYSLLDAMKPQAELQQIAEEKKASKKTARTPKPAESQNVSTEIDQIHAYDLHVQPLDIPQPPVPYLEYGLDRVLFSPGIHQLQDPTSRVYNFDPYLQKIMPVAEFDFNALKEYKTSSEDHALANLADQHGKKYIGSTSSMTSCLSQFHHLLSSFRPLNLDMLTKTFNKSGPGFTSHTALTRAPSAIFLRWKDGSHAIDADKEFDSGNVLMLLGKSMELLLTQTKSDYERYRKSDPRPVPEEQMKAPESYQYTTMGDFLMRSQLDAYDPRLPDNGTFDLKTRAVVSVRMDAQDYEPMTGYELYTLQGKWGSYEREYFDMIRATMLKYMLQARMGRMNGIFVAYHNVKRIFGFQYIPMREMDLALHGQVDPALGDQEFRVSLELLNKLLDKATAKYPKQSLRIHFDTRQDSSSSKSLTSLHMFAEPMGEREIDAIQNKSKAKIQEFERSVMGLEPPCPEYDSPTEPSNGLVPEGSDSEAAFVSSSRSNETSPTAAPSSDTDGSDASNSNTYTETSSPLKNTSSKDPSSTEQTSTTEEELKPLFYASLIVKSKINGEYIYGDRPENLSCDHKWTVEYLMQEYEVGRSEWAAYEAVKARRKEAYSDEDAEGDDESGIAAQKKEEYYIRFLRDMAARGSSLRERIDEMEKDKVPVVVGEPLPRAREKIERVDDYLRELYKKKEVY